VGRPIGDGSGTCGESVAQTDSDFRGGRQGSFPVHRDQRRSEDAVSRMQMVEVGEAVIRERSKGLQKKLL